MLGDRQYHNEGDDLPPQGDGTAVIRQLTHHAGKHGKTLADQGKPPLARRGQGGGGGRVGGEGLGKSQPQGQRDDSQAAEYGSHGNEEVAEDLIGILLLVGVGNVAQIPVLRAGLPQGHFGNAVAEEQTHKRVPQLVDGGSQGGGSHDHPAAEAPSHHAEKQKAAQGYCGTADQDRAQRVPQRAQKEPNVGHAITSPLQYDIRLLYMIFAVLSRCFRGGAPFAEKNERIS